MKDQALRNLAISFFASSPPLLEALGLQGEKLVPAGTPGSAAAPAKKNEVPASFKDWVKNTRKRLILFLRVATSQEEGEKVLSDFESRIEQIKKVYREGKAEEARKQKERMNSELEIWIEKKKETKIDLTMEELFGDENEKKEKKRKIAEKDNEERSGEK